MSGSEHTSWAAFSRSQLETSKPKRWEARLLPLLRLAPRTPLTPRSGCALLAPGRAGCPRPPGSAARLPRPSPISQAAAGEKRARAQEGPGGAEGQQEGGGQTAPDAAPPRSPAPCPPPPALSPVLDPDGHLEGTGRRNNRRPGPNCPPGSPEGGGRRAPRPGGGGKGAPGASPAPPAPGPLPTRPALLPPGSGRGGP